MKVSTKPISSPGKTEKFPPPLMRFLRSNAGNKSRGRSRSSPMFLRKKNTTAAIDTKEPSSPKVTCVGQVRARRSSSKQPTAKKGHPSTVTVAGAPTKCRCSWWVPHTLFCHRKKPGSYCQSVRPNWWCFRSKGKATKVTEASTKNGSSFRGRLNNESERESEEENRVNANAFVSNSSSSSTPPRNALLLTRCKSAPYRSSSLASRFWGSPLRSEETEQVPSEKNQRPSEFVSEREGMNEKDPKLELKLRFFKELEDSLRERITESEKVHELKKKEEADGDSAPSALPLVLTRCKSERPRTAQKIDTCTPHGF